MEIRAGIYQGSARSAFNTKKKKKKLEGYWLVTTMTVPRHNVYVVFIIRITYHKAVRPSLFKDRFLFEPRQPA